VLSLVSLRDALPSGLGTFSASSRCIIGVCIWGSIDEFDR